MIEVLPGQSFSFNSPHRDMDATIEEISRLIRGTAHFVGDIEVLNKTKRCKVEVVMQRGKMTVIVTNPKDEEFDLNELENPLTPVHITGR